MVGLRGSFDNRQDLEWVKPNGAGQNDELNDINPAFAAFNSGNKGLMVPEPISQFLLTKTRLDPGVDQRLAQSLLWTCPGIVPLL